MGERYRNWLQDKVARGVLGEFEAQDLGEDAQVALEGLVGGYLRTKAAKTARSLLAERLRGPLNSAMLVRKMVDVENRDRGHKSQRLAVPKVSV